MKTTPLLPATASPLADGLSDRDTSDLLEIGGLARLLLISIGLVAAVALLTSWLTLTLASASA